MLEERQPHLLQAILALCLHQRRERWTFRQ